MSFKVAMVQIRTSPTSVQRAIEKTRITAGMNKKFSRDDSASLLQALGQTIHRRRAVLDLTQEQLAERCGLHRTYISDIERGARNPSLITIHRIARALEISVASMMATSETDEIGAVDVLALGAGAADHASNGAEKVAHSNTAIAAD
jgi:transcriptional regulator with XRE-family HTH domain